MRLLSLMSYTDCVIMDKRYDNRTKSQFIKDIKFGTMMETYIFSKWVDTCQSRNGVTIYSYDDNGIANDGKYVKTGTNTSGADYVVDICYNEIRYDKLPMEVKWVPTAGKFTLKVNDLKAYIKEDAAILFVFNAGSPTLKRPKNYNFEKYIEKVESYSHNLKWSIMLPNTVETFLAYHINQDKIQAIPYMGYKPGIILKEKDFHYWFKTHDWLNYGNA
jgi:hypothetical protein